MTPEPAVLPAGKVNRFEVFHHERKRDIRLYTEFETAVMDILRKPETPSVVPARVLRDTLTRDYPWVRWQVKGIDVFKAMLSWFRYQNPKTVERFRIRRTERGRRVGGQVDWAAKSKKAVGISTILKLAQTLRGSSRRTTMTLLKRDAGVRFNQNYNAEVSSFIRSTWPSLAALLPAKRNRVR